jgi:hypothetical protein
MLIIKYEISVIIVWMDLAPKVDSRGNLLLNNNPIKEIING